jgi:hypothetical protein
LRVILPPAHFPGVLPLPMCMDCHRHLHQPRPIFGRFQKVCRGKILGAVGRGVAKWLKQPGVNQRRNIMRLTVEHPPGLLGVEAHGQLSEKSQEPLLIFFHPQHQSAHRRKPNRIYLPCCRNWRNDVCDSYPVLEIEARVEAFENGRGFSLRALAARKPRGTTI